MFELKGERLFDYAKEKMIIPEVLENAIEDMAINHSGQDIRENVENISKKYMNPHRGGAKIVSTNEDVLAYVESRMPATYAAAYTCLQKVMEFYNGDVSSVLDYGAGTGAVTWAVNELIAPHKIVCLEREKEMIKIGKQMLHSASNTYQNVEWMQGDVVHEKYNTKCDMVTSSYVMNELVDNDKEVFLNHLWESANKVILLIEPGTMYGYRNIMMARNFFVSRNACIIAPCTHQMECCLQEDDWCHFSCRIQRNRLQRYVKHGDAPFEDEKFSYIAISKGPVDKAQMRIIRHPIIKKGFVELSTCSPDGRKTVTCTAKNKEQYKKAKKAKWGDSFH